MHKAGGGGVVGGGRGEQKTHTQKSMKVENPNLVQGICAHQNPASEIVSADKNLQVHQFGAATHEMLVFTFFIFRTDKFKVH